MPSEPRHLDARTQTRSPEYRSPEEDELQRKRTDLQHIQSELAESELELATLRSELVAFERRYLEFVGSRYAELDSLEAQIAEAIAQREPRDSSAREKANAARARAQESAEALGDVGQERSARDFEPTEELKALYRQAAKELHPDLTTDAQEKTRRQRAMLEVNKAYEDCDAERIKQILDQWRSSPDHIRGDDTAAQLVRVIRELAQARKRLDVIKAEIEELAQAGLSCLKRQVEDAGTYGRDLLAEIAGQLDARIEEARSRLKVLSKAGAPR